MEIATNAVLLAMLMQASEVVEKLGLPLQSPLQTTNVRTFRVSALPGPEETTKLSCYLFYRGGYQFWHDNGRISSFSTPQAYDPGMRTWPTR